VLLRQGDAVGGRGELERLVGDSPGDPEGEAALGKLLLAQGDLDGAEKHLRASLAVASNDPGALYCLGLALAKKKERAEALAVFDRLEVVTPDKSYAPYGRAVAAAVSGDRESALEWLGRALARGVDDLDAVARDPAFLQLASDPRFAALLAEARARAGPKKGPPDR
jgi:tetratricopeptide (TPR) repeat protein